MKQETESDIVRSICEYLYAKGHFFWRQNTGGMYRDGRFFRMPAFSMKGVPDIILIKDGWFVGIEVKRDKAKQSPEQKEFERRCKESGAEYYVVKSIDDCIEIGL